MDLWYGLTLRSVISKCVGSCNLELHAFEGACALFPVYCMYFSLWPYNLKLPQSNEAWSPTFTLEKVEKGTTRLVITSFLVFLSIIHVYLQCFQNKMRLWDFSVDCDICHFNFGNEHETMFYAIYSPSSTHSWLSTCTKAMENRKISSDMKECALNLWNQGWDTEDWVVKAVA